MKMSGLPLTIIAANSRFSLLAASTSLLNLIGFCEPLFEDLTIPHGAAFSLGGRRATGREPDSGMNRSSSSATFRESALKFKKELESPGCGRDTATADTSVACEFRGCFEAENAFATLLDAEVTLVTTGSTG